jgi:hypothetical protein
MQICSSSRLPLPPRRLWCKAYLSAGSACCPQTANQKALKMQGCRSLDPIRTRNMPRNRTASRSTPLRSVAPRGTARLNLTTLCQEPSRAESARRIQYIDGCALTSSSANCCVEHHRCLAANHPGGRAVRSNDRAATLRPGQHGRHPHRPGDGHQPAGASAPVRLPPPCHSIDTLELQAQYKDLSGSFHRPFKLL